MAHTRLLCHCIVSRAGPGRCLTTIPRRPNRRGEQRQTQRRGFGGAWRGWVRLQLKSVSPSQKRIAEAVHEYRAAKASRTVECQRAADLGLAMSGVAQRNDAVDRVTPPFPTVRTRQRFRGVREAMETMGAGANTAANASAAWVQRRKATVTGHFERRPGRRATMFDARDRRAEP